MGEVVGATSFEETRRTPLVTPPFALVTLSTFLGMLSVGALLPVLARYADGPLGAGPTGVGIAVGAASATALVAQPLAGRLGDRRGRRVLCVGGPLLLAAASAGYLGADGLAGLLVFRLVAGIGEGFLLVGGASMVSDLAPVERRGEAFSLFSVALYGGIALGPLLGELVLDGDRFDTVWLTTAAIAFTGALLALFVRETLPETARSHASAGLLHRAALGPGIVLLVALVGFGGFNAFVALYALELGLGGGGLVFLEFSAIVVAVRLLGAKLPDALGPARCAALSLALIAAGFLVIGGFDSTTSLFAGTAVFALGQSLAYPALVTLALSRAPASDRSAVIGTFSAFVDLAIVVGAAGLGVVASVAGYRGAFIVAAAVALAGFAPLLRLSRHIATMPSAGPSARNANA